MTQQESRQQADTIATQETVPSDQKVSSSRFARLRTYLKNRKEPPALPRIEGKELEDILRGHRTWLESEGQEGKKADLSYKDLQKAVLPHLDLRHVNFRGTDLRKSDLKNAQLLGADFRDSNMQGTDLTGVTDLLPDQLAGADLKGAKLPPEMAFDRLKNVEEMSKNAGKYVVAIEAACVYALVTIATTSDAGFFTDSVSSKLPIVDVSVPTIGFYLVAPLFLLGAYLYFNLELQRLWEGLAKLPAVFPDGIPIDEKAYPWLLNGLVRIHSVRLRQTAKPLMRMQKWLSVLLTWWTVPLLLLCFWLRYLRGHDPIGTGWHIGLLVVSIIAGILFHRLAVRTLSRPSLTSYHMRQDWKDKRTYKAASAIVVLLLLTISLAACSYVAIKGIHIRLANRFFSYLGGTDLRMAHLSKSHLTEANLNGVRLSEADLSEADLRLADLSRANLSRADLRGAELKGARFKGASLTATILRDVPIIEADLTNDQLRQANLIGADFSNAQLNRNNLSDLTLTGADFNNAHLFGADLSEANLSRANLSRANLSRADLRGANLSEANLRGANLNNAHLFGADLSGANLRGADLSKANLSGADLRGADLSDTLDLIKEQIAQAKTDKTTKLPAE